jgi:hypothetical protein
MYTQIEKKEMREAPKQNRLKTKQIQKTAKK